MSLASKRHAEDEHHDPKRLKAGNGTSTNGAFVHALFHQGKQLFSTLPKVRDDQAHEVLAKVLREVNLKVSVISAPGKALSVHVPDANNSTEGAYDALWIMLGMSPKQEALERQYAAIKERYVSKLFCSRMRNGLDEQTLTACDETIKAVEEALHDERKEFHIREHMKGLIDIIARLTTHQPDALEKELGRFVHRNTTLANACFQLFLQATGIALSEVVLKSTPGGGRGGRVTLTFYEAGLGNKRPETFSWLPALHMAVHKGPNVLVVETVDGFWRYLWRHGYFPSAKFRETVSPQLKLFFHSALVRHNRTNLSADFNPSYHFSLYLHGLAGAGKSSFIQRFVPALAATINEFLDPDMDVRFVKQNLNKTREELDMELELRPNNNDLSVMSIIQGRRMTLAQSKPGMVVVGLEEVPPVSQELGPDSINQLSNIKLLADRFSGLRGEHITPEARKRLEQQNRTGISAHASVLTIFTSNYELDPRSLEMLRELNMFRNLLIIPVCAIADEDRQEFAIGYLCQLLHDYFPHSTLNFEVSLCMDLGRGDIRALVRYLRSISFFLASEVRAGALLSRAGPQVTSHEGKADKIRFVVKEDYDSGLVSLSLSDGAFPIVELCHGHHFNLFPTKRKLIDTRTESVIAHLEKKMPKLEQAVLDDLAHVIDYYFGHVLIPAVVLCRSTKLAKAIIESLGQVEGISIIKGIDATKYKIVKSLYDSEDTRSLRDDIISLRRMAPEALVGIEIEAKTMDSQIKIRELTEDTPSMVAFSTYRSALRKKGLFFVVFFDEVLTPELNSRASLVINHDDSHHTILA